MLQQENNMHTKLLIIGVVLIAAVVFGFWFWGQFIDNQKALSDIPAQNTQSQSSSSKKASDPASLENDLNNTDLTGLDAEEMDLSGL
jgi:Tfp pilus assembly protein PilO